MMMKEKKTTRIISEEEEEELRIIPSNTHCHLNYQQHYNHYNSQHGSMHNIITPLNNNINKSQNIMIVKEDEHLINEQGTSGLNIIRAWHQQLDQQHSLFRRFQGTTMQGNQAQDRYNPMAYNTAGGQKKTVEEEVIKKTIGGTRSNENGISLALSLQPTSPLLIEKSNMSSTNVSEISEQAISSYSTSTSRSWDHPINLDLSISLCST